MKKSEITNGQILRAINHLSRQVRQNTADIKNVKNVLVALTRQVKINTADIKELKKALHDLTLSVNEFANYVEGRFNQVDNRFNQIENRFNQVDNRLIHLEQGQDDIKLRLDNVPYRFELKDLDKRIIALEAGN